MCLSVPWKWPYAFTCELPEGQHAQYFRARLLHIGLLVLEPGNLLLRTPEDCEPFLLDQEPSISFTVSGLGKTWNRLQAGVCWHAGIALPSVRILHFFGFLPLPACLSLKLWKMWNLDDFIFNGTYQSFQGKLYHRSPVMLNCYCKGMEKIIGIRYLSHS